MPDMRAFMARRQDAAPRMQGLGLMAFVPDGRSSSERGYGRTHRLARARWAPMVERGEVDCALCGHPVTPGTRWHLDHTPTRDGYRGPAHGLDPCQTCGMRCNVRDGAQRGRARQGSPMPEPKRWIL